MLYHSFADIARLSVSNQRHLLQHGDATERVWAAWALGIALGGGSITDLVAGVHDSPAPGTRRHLLIVLAGLGESAVLQTFAQDDPDDYVRATAAQYLLRISQSTDIATPDFIRTLLLNDPSPIVKQAILTEAPPSFPAFRHQDIITLLEHPDVDIRRAATDRLLAISSYTALFPGPLEDRITYETDSTLRHRLLRLCIEVGGAVRLLFMCRNLDAEKVIEILQLLRSYDQQFNWTDIAPLALIHDPRFDCVLVLLLNAQMTSDMVEWFLYLMARAMQWPSARNRPEAERAEAVQTSAWKAAQRLIATSTQLWALKPVTLNIETLDFAISYLDNEVTQLQLDEESEEWETNSDWYSTAIPEREQLRGMLIAIKAIS